MSLTVLSPGVQTSVQGAPRRGERHLGVPWSGAADPVSLALANRLCGNQPDCPGLEVTFGGLTLRAEADVTIAVTGAQVDVRVGDRPEAMHRSIALRQGEEISIGQTRRGMRAYVAVSGGIDVPSVFGSSSTYLPGGFGGFEGRALKQGDRLSVGVPHQATPGLETPAELRLSFGRSTVLRVVRSAEFERLDEDAKRQLFEKPFRAATQIDRMGIRLERNRLKLCEAVSMKSSAVFPGIVQLPDGGEPILLGPDAQTTGGYARILSVAAVDMHLIGQIAPRSEIRFFLRTAEEAAEDLDLRERLLRSWIGGQSDRLVSSA